MKLPPDSFEREIERMGNAVRANAGFIILFVLGVLHLLKKVEFDWPVIVVFAIALLPPISRLVDYLKAGKDGVEMKMRAGARSAEEVEKAAISKRSLSDVQLHLAPVAPTSEFSNLWDDQKKILKSLWHFQKTTFGITADTRWGFAVGPDAPDYYSFLSGAGMLAVKDLITIGDKGMVFLTSKGIDFCTRHEAELNAYPLYYRHFRSA